MNKELFVNRLCIVLGMIALWLLIPNYLYAAQQEFDAVSGEAIQDDVVYTEEQPYKLEDFSNSNQDRIQSITSYQQSDIRWGAHPYGYGYLDDGSMQEATISTSGCGLLSYTNAVYYLNGNFIDPTILADYAVQNGYRVNGIGTSWSLYEAFARSYGNNYKIKYSGATSSYETLREHLISGGVAVGSVPGHLMAIVDYNSSTGEYLILDSARASIRNTYPDGYTWQTESAMKSNEKLNFRDFRLISSTITYASSSSSQTVKPQIVGNTGSVTLAKGDRVAVMKAPVTLDAGDVTYTTNNKSVIALEQKGSTIYAKALKNGTATITASGTRSGIKKGTLKVSVVTSKKATSVEFMPNDTTLYQGQVVKTKITTTPAQASKQMTYKSSNPEVATVSSNGLIRGIAPGSATITATTKDGTNKSSVSNITVTGIKWSGKEKVLTVGDRVNVNEYVVFTPSYVANNAKYISSDSSVLEVDGQYLLAKEAGKVSLTVKANDRSGVTKTYQFAVKDLQEKEEYTITFDSNGGNDISAIAAKEGDIISNLPIPVKENYKFTGWVDESGQVVTEIIVTKDMILTASWEEIIPEFTSEVTNDTTEGGETSNDGEMPLN